MRLRYSARARRDISEIGRYIAERDPGAELRVRDAIRETLRMLATHPRAGRTVGRDLHRFAVPRLPYLVFYQVDEAGGDLLVVTIRHGARAPFDVEDQGTS